MGLKFLLQERILKGSTGFFKEILDITIDPVATSEIDLSDFLKEYLTDTKLLGKVADARMVGMINDRSLEGKKDNGDAGLALDNASDDYDMLLVFGIQAKEGVSFTRTDITRLTRALNRRSFSRPVVVLFRYNALLSFAAAERGQFKRSSRQGEKIGRISILRDIRLDNVHAGHERILLQLRINPLKVTSFKELYEQWQEVFNISILNREFYSELFTWYLWAVRTVSFPNLVDDDKDDTVYNSENVIRLLTRLIFCWFVKEKALVPDALFDKKIISETLKNFNPDAEDDSCYYKAILQNLFFATLNTEMPKDGGKRSFIDDSKKNKNTGYTEEYMDHLVFRYKNHFNKPGNGLKLFENIPFLNGGLFECLDRRDPETNVEMRIDGFSSKPKKQPTVPNILFFGRNDDLDLSDEFENGKKYKHCKVRGIINILNSYKFTIEENTPLEQEIALDPELLGRIFENLLASYNPETRTTARKQTGSYYTPREIVNYMVDESLIAYLKTKLTEKGQAFLEFGKKQTNIFGNEGKKGQLSMQVDLAAGKWDKKTEELETKLRELFAYETDGNPFEGDEGTTQAIIAHLSECKILDPACGSGAFPMGILHKMVFALGKLDPCNYTWKQAQLEKAQRDKLRAQQFEDESLRQAALKSAEDKIKYIEESFGETGHELDYTRKLFLIENCIYGVDIQQIAVQISKLRFFISLMVDQRVANTKPNRNILSLPNLETKFVAANTLIPVDKQQQGTLISMDANVKKIENELHDIRQRVFFTKKWPDKKKLKKQEFEKRKELQKALVASGFPESAAGQVASWDPFDPLNSASFFDPEIMFAVEGDKNGGFFDVVIGNPPYVDSEMMVQIFPLLREKLKDIYKSAKGNWDLFIVFIEKGIKLLTLNGTFSFIIPNKIIGAKYSKDLRKFLLNYTFLEIRDYSRINVFKEQDVYPVTLLMKQCKHQKNGFVKMTVMNSLINIDYNQIIDNKIHYKDIYWDMYFFHIEISNLLIKIFNNSKLNTLDIRVFGAATVNESYKIKEILKDNKNYKGYKFINTGTIDRYISLWGIAPTQYIKDSYSYPYIESSDLEKINPTRLNQAQSPKIIVAGMSIGIEAFLDVKAKFIAGKSTSIILGNLLLLKYVIALLNSRLISFFMNHFCYSLKMSGGYLNIGTDVLENLPIPLFSNYCIFEKLVNICIENNSIENRNSQMGIIDFMVYKLYTLTYDECKIVDPGIEKLISREDYESMGVEELAEYEMSEIK